MDMSGVAQEKRSAFAETLRNPVMHVIGREPVHAVDRDAEPLHHARVEVLPSHLLAVALSLGRDSADDATAMCALHRE
jgi:hypothetical protein